MKKIYSTIIVGILLCKCCIAQQYGITYTQERNTHATTGSYSKVILERAPFTISYFAKINEVMQVAVINSPQDTVGLFNKKTLQEISFFEPGTGMAPHINGFYDDIYISNVGHHYLFYNSENDRRTHNIWERGEDLQLAWNIQTAYYNGVQYEFKQLPLHTIFFVFYSDTNANKMIDPNELQIVEIHFQ